jgi:hypothetical protein
MYVCMYVIMYVIFMLKYSHYSIHALYISFLEVYVASKLRTKGLTRPTKSPSRCSTRRSFHSTVIDHFNCWMPTRNIFTASTYTRCLLISKNLSTTFFALITFTWRKNNFIFKWVQSILHLYCKMSKMQYISIYVVPYLHLSKSILFKTKP